MRRAYWCFLVAILTFPVAAGAAEEVPALPSPTPSSGVGVAARFLLPFGDWSDVAGPGGGALADFRLRYVAPGHFTADLFAGAGYYKFADRTLAYGTVLSSWSVPMLLGLRVRAQGDTPMFISFAVGGMLSNVHAERPEFENASTRFGFTDELLLGARFGRFDVGAGLVSYWRAATDCHQWVASAHYSFDVGPD